jgi:NADH:ubiquinone oxidoreductase subunit E
LVFSIFSKYEKVRKTFFKFMSNQQETSPKRNKTVHVKVCASPKSCTKKGAKYIWERVCNENGITDHSIESFEKGGVHYEKTMCQGACEKGPNIRLQEGDDNESKVTLLSFMNPLKTGRLVKKVQSGVPIKDITRL